MANRSAGAADWAVLILRLAIGIAFIVHGYPKVFPDGPSGFAGFVRTLGFPAPLFFAWIVAVVEFFGGIAMVIGLLVRYVGALMAIEMLVTTVRVKMRSGVDFISQQGTGWELDFLLFAIALALVLLGSGVLAVDAALKSRRPAMS